MSILVCMANGEVAEVCQRIMDTLHPEWETALSPVQAQLEYIVETTGYRIVKGVHVLPEDYRILRALNNPVKDTRVLIVGQDPYPTPGHAVGLAFSSSADVRPFPKSLGNIYKEYCDDLGYPMPTSADLTPWQNNGVMLLNRVLTVEAGKPDSDKDMGWETVTEQVIQTLSASPHPFVALLWGSKAQQLKTFLPPSRVLTAPHPSPLSAYRGFFGSKPFSTANMLLKQQGGLPVNWRLP